MRLKKVLYSFILFVFSPLFFSISVYAISLSDIDDYFDITGKFNELLWQTNQISTNQEHMQHILNDMYSILRDGGYSVSNTGTSLSNEGLVTIDSDGNLVLSVALRNAISQAVQNEINNNMGFFYAYSYSGADWLDRFQDQDMYRSFLNVLNENDDKFIIAYTYAHNYPSAIYVYDLTDLTFLYSSYDSSQSYYYGSLYKNWSTVTSSALYKFYTLSNGLYVEDTAPDFLDGAFFKRTINGIITSVSVGYRACNLNAHKYQIYKSFSSLQAGSMGVQDYYTGNDFSTNTVNNTSTITQTQLDNSISYQNIVDYTNNYYLTNNNYPTTNIVNNYINNYDGSGGSGGSGSDDDDEDDEDNGFWNLIKKVLGFISKLFDTIAGFLADLVDSLGDIVNSVIDNILSIFANLKDGIPHVISDLLTWFFPFLPEEIIALVELSITCMVVIGLIRLIRG